METYVKEVTAEELRPYVAATEGTLLIWPTVGVLAALFFASFATDSGLLKALAIVFYVLGVFAVVGWQANKAGVQPSFGSMPKALRRNMYAFWGLTAVMGSVVVTLSLATSFVVGGVLAGIIMTVGGSLYHLRARSIVERLQAL